MPTPPEPPPATAPAQTEDRIGLSVWLVGQHPSRIQRRGRYLSASMAHPAKMLPALAAHAITAYTRPGELVLDPMCGIGTTLVEATHTGRDAIGIEHEPRWGFLAARNLRHATDTGATGHGTVLIGDSRHIAPNLAGELGGRVALLLTSPPYGRSVHGHVEGHPGHGVTKWHHSYGPDKTNLAHQNTGALLAGFTTILRGCLPLLRPGGTLVITTRPWRRSGMLIDFPTAVLHAATRAGYQPVQRCAALLAAVRDSDLINRGSFFQLTNTRTARAHGHPIHLIQHEDVLILRRPPRSASTACAGPPPPGRTTRMAA
jgi:modification methylase